KLGRLAATFVLEGFNIREKWADLEHYARAAQKSKELMRDEQFARQVQDFVEGAVFEQVRELEQKATAATSSSAAVGKPPQENLLATAGQRYRAFADEFPHSKWADVGLYNAIVISDKANQ